MLYYKDGRPVRYELAVLYCEQSTRLMRQWDSVERGLTSTQRKTLRCLAEALLRLASRGEWR